jgi:hypothetical protein
VRLRTRSDRPTCSREIQRPGERDAEEQASASRSSRTRFSLVAVDEAVVRVAFRLIYNNQSWLPLRPKDESARPVRSRRPASRAPVC